MEPGEEDMDAALNSMDCEALEHEVPLGRADL